MTIEKKQETEEEKRTKDTQNNDDASSNDTLTPSSPSSDVAMVEGEKGKVAIDEKMKEEPSSSSSNNNGNSKIPNPPPQEVLEENKGETIPTASPADDLIQKNENYLEEMDTSPPPSQAISEKEKQENNNNTIFSSSTASQQREEKEGDGQKIIVTTCDNHRKNQAVEEESSSSSVTKTTKNDDDENNNNRDSHDIKEEENVFDVNVKEEEDLTTTMIMENDQKQPQTTAVSDIRAGVVASSISSSSSPPKEEDKEERGKFSKIDDDIVVDVATLNTATTTTTITAPRNDDNNHVSLEQGVDEEGSISVVAPAPGAAPTTTTSTEGIDSKSHMPSSLSTATNNNTIKSTRLTPVSSSQPPAPPPQQSQTVNERKICVLKKTEENTTTIQPSPPPPPSLLSLNIDAIHSISKFLSVKDWSNLSLVSTSTNRICREIFKRVKMHGFKCATEVVAAWKLGQQADARELCALYIHSGVPIYPYSLGHSYHTLIWRMGVEAREMKKRNTDSNNSSAVDFPSNNNTTNNDGDGRVAGGRGEDDDDDRNNTSSATTHHRGAVERFSTERYETRAREGYSSNFTYLEEKSIYLIEAGTATTETTSPASRRTSAYHRDLAQILRRQFMLSPTPLLRHQQHHQLQHVNHFATTAAATVDDPMLVAHASLLARSATMMAAAGGGLMQDRERGGASSSTGGNNTNTTRPRRRYSNSYSEQGMIKPPKIPVTIHRHLLDQHLLGRPSVNDNDGTMVASPVSLSVDFFHPHFSLGHHRQSSMKRKGAPTPTGNSADPGSAANGNGNGVAGQLLPAWNNAVGLGALVGGSNNQNESIATGNTNSHNGPGSLLHPNTASATNVGIFGDEDDSDSESEIAMRAAQSMMMTANADNNTLLEPPTGVAVALEPDSQRIEASNSQRNLVESPIFQPAPSSVSCINVLSSIDLEVYNSSSINSKAIVDKHDSREMRNHLATRFGVYRRRLEALVTHGDSVGFEECILDFWDEFLPQTANIQYYDCSTPVPRLTGLQKFLTKPCPKAIGIVQCEIERIRLNPKKKRVNMKERFFPKYEYRLFIRHNPVQSSENEAKARRDTVLMMAKNKGRKHVEGAALPQGKKGSNNYYLYMPRQDDVEDHYEAANQENEITKPVPNGASLSPQSQDGSVLLGRLQSNFIGTEFQIFTPQVRKPGNPKTMARSMTTPVGSTGVSSDDEFGYGSGLLSDNASSSYRRKSRFGRLSLRRNSTAEQPTIVEEETSRFSNRGLRRSRSSGDICSTHNRLGRTSRRAIANTGTAETAEPQRLVLCEEEDGAITYTANLLGSRPRIMDVCVPKVEFEGLPGAEWRKYVENCVSSDESSGSRMLNHLKQIQSRMENEDQGRVVHVGAGTRENGDENQRGYTPPGDFGLLALQNRPPWWNIELGSFVLNFGGRVSVASVKNFQLCDRSDQDYIMLQFGRIAGRHSFTMDFQHPLTPVQAFAIAISSLQSKISLS